MNENNISQELIDGMEILIENFMKRYSFDKTRTGSVLAVNSNGTYNIKVDNKNFTNVLALNKIALSVNDIVKVVFPENQISNMFILGKI